MKMDSKRN